MFKSARNSSLIAVSPLVVALLSPTAMAQEPLSVTDADGNQVVIAEATRVATLGGVVTEVAYALGAQDQIVAVDDSSFYPPEALAEKPTLGYYRALTAEPVLAAAPTLLIGNEEAGPSEALAQLRDAGVTTLLLPDQNNVEGARDLIRTLGLIFGREEMAQELITQLDQDVAAAEALVAQATTSPRVLFLLRPPGAPTLVAGADTAAGEVIALAGGQNIFPGFDGYIPMTPEGIAEIAPDVILTTDASLTELGGMDALLAAAGVAQTPAAENGRIVAMDDLYLLGFGPRTGQAIADLALLLHPELAS
jgi:iron complex transport system substrate-binding protein